MAALVAIGATLAGERPTFAAGFSGIILTGGVTQGGDPQYTYTIDAFLVNDTIPPFVNGLPTATITMGILGLEEGDAYLINYQTYLPPAAIWLNTITPNTDFLDFFGSSPNTAGTDPVPLFELVIITPPNAIGLNPGDRVDYTWTISGQQPGSGFFILGGAVPEPSSILLMAVGAVALPYLEFRRRRRTAQVA
jgi:hypothetical protein